VSHMKTTTIRELKHATTKVLGWTEAGESVEVQRRGKPVALLTPLRRGKRAVKPNFKRRLREIYGATVLPSTATELIHDARGDR
jgi:prevent-host-death family protein